jgi:hypothetical protein
MPVSIKAWKGGLAVAMFLNKLRAVQFGERKEQETTFGSVRVSTTLPSLPGSGINDPRSTGRRLLGVPELLVRGRSRRVYLKTQFSCQTECRFQAHDHRH